MNKQNVEDSTTTNESDEVIELQQVNLIYINLNIKIYSNLLLLSLLLL